MEHATDEGALRLGARLHAGRTAEIYRWSETEIVKLYQPRIPREAIERERNNTLIAWSMGLPVPSVGGIITRSGRLGLILERIDGPTAMRQIEMDVSLGESYARRLAELHVSLNLLPADRRLPGQRDQLRNKIARGRLLASSEQEKILGALARMPAGDRLCHGDFHPGNVIIAKDRFCLIDWIDASRGDPAADLARSSILFRGHIATSPVSTEERRLMALFHQVYLEAYWQGMGINREHYPIWLLISAAARLSEGIPELNDWLSSEIRRGLALIRG